MARKHEILTFDFETTKSETNPEVYSWAIAKRNGYNNYDIVDGIELDTFMETVFSLEEDYTMYAHNGSKFDFQFILPWLYENGFKQLVIEDPDVWEESEFNYEGEYDNLIIEEKNRPLVFGEYQMLVDDSFKIIELKLALPSTKMNKGKARNRVLRFRDSNLMFASRLADYGNALNAQFKTRDWTKMELVGGYTRETKYESYIAFMEDGNEREYLHQDVKILSEFLHMMMEVIPFNKWKLTAAGTAYGIWKNDFIGEDLINHYGKMKEVIKFKPSKAGENDDYWLYKFAGGKNVYPKPQMVNELFVRHFPLDWMKKVNIDGLFTNRYVVNQGYQGGLTMANPTHAGKVVENIAYIDINSSYPTQMKNGLFPWGLPIYEEPTNKAGFRCLYKLEVKQATVEKGLPFMYAFLKGESGKHYPYTVKNMEYVLTDEELERFETYYKGEYEITFLVAFEGISGSQIFGEYIDYWYKVKAEAKNVAEKLAAKLFLNALYGKFGQDIDRSARIYTNGRWMRYSMTSDPKFYLPLAVWITSYARMYMVDAVGERFEYVNYLDTDSLSIICPNVDLNNDAMLKQHLEENYKVVINSEWLGGWDIEYKIKKMITRRAKQYYFVDDKDIPHVKFAGLRISEWEDSNKYREEDIPEDLNKDIGRITFKSFATGMTGFQQLRPNRLPSGIMLEEYEKNINPIWDYDLNPSYWFQSKEEYMNYWDRLEK